MIIESWDEMTEEIEKKYLIPKEKVSKLKNDWPNKTIGIIQWYIDGAKDHFKSKRIRMVLTKDGKQQWILGKKEIIDGNLIHRIEEETKVNESPIHYEALKQFPFIIKSRSILSSPFHVEVVLDKLLENPYLSYDVEHILEVELKDNEDDLDRIIHEVFDYFKLDKLEDVSKDFNYSNHAIALRAKKKNNEKGKEFTTLLKILEKEIRSDRID